ncbi:MAG: transcriptional repressor NrdR [Armatimonadia bacterium]|nr:transcriptional repressor NrdR [Armatimonadia bacterium]
MRCPFCRHEETRVLDSRDTDEGAATRRRRECSWCGRRFTTYERIEGTMLAVRKKSGRTEPFEAGKLRAGVAIACEKRPITPKQIDELVLETENHFRDQGVGQVSSQEIGRYVMAGLKRLDEVAYVRFASVYQEFDEVRSFVSAVESLADTEAGKGSRPGEDDSGGDLALPLD